MGDLQTIMVLSPIGMPMPVSAEVIGQLAINYTQIMVNNPDEEYTLTHVASGYRLWSFEAWVKRDEIRRLAEMLARYDFDAYVAGGYQDWGFVERVKAVYDEWDATYPDRLAVDRLRVD